MIYLIYILSLVILLGLCFGVRFWYRQFHQRKKIEWMRSQKYVLLHILVPKENEKSPVSAEQMFASLHGIFRPEEKWQEQISFEIVSRDKFIHFYAHVPIHFKDFLEGQIYAQYPNVEIFEVEDYSTGDFSALKKVGCELLLNKNEVFPIKTFVSFEVDPLAAITSVLAKVKDDEQIWVQIIIRPLSDNWQDKGINYVQAIKSGAPLKKSSIILRLFKSFFAILTDFFITAMGRTETEPVSTTGVKKEIKLSGPLEAALKSVEEKVTKLGFSTKIRIMVLGPDEYSAKAKTSIIAGAFKQFSTVNLNGFEPSKIQSGRDFLSAYKKREFFDQGYILNIEELASLYHLPTTSVETPSIVWAGSKKGEPPADLPIEGVVDSERLTIFAKSDFRHIVHRFGIKKDDRRLHMYAVGKTGTGKSTMLENMIIDDIKKGRGVAVVDPHGELISHVMDFIPSSRINDVIFFNPADRDWPIGFNILESVDPDLKNIIASGVVGIFKKIFGESWGPRLEYILRNTILALLDYPDSTILGIMKILVDKDYRKKVVEKIKDPVIRDFFFNEYEKYDPKFRTEAIAPIQNKVGQFLSSSTIRNIVGQPKSTIDIEEIMNQGKIILIDLSIGKIGEDNSALLGAMLITKIQLAAMRRTNIPEEKRRDFYLYVDEFQNFATESFAVILSEARKYRLSLIMTNQFIAQMNEVVAKAIFGNVGSIVSFRVGPTDASFLIKEFEPVFEANDLVNLDNYHVYIKMAIDGVTRPAFSAITLPPVKGETTNREKIIKVSRERYAKPREFVEDKIQQWTESQKPDKKDKINTFLEKNYNQAIDQNIIDDSSFREVKDSAGAKWYLINKDYNTIDVKDKIKNELEDNNLINDQLVKEELIDKKDEMPIESLSKKNYSDKKEPDTRVLKSILAPILAKKFQKNMQKRTKNDQLISFDEEKNILSKSNQKKIENIQTLNPDEVIKLD